MLTTVRRSGRRVTALLAALALGVALALSLLPAQAQSPLRDVVPDQRAAQVERDFLMGMVPHHRGAIRMSELALQKATKPELREFAQKVIDEQNVEIALMTNYLRDWYGAQPPAGDMPSDAMMRQMNMPMMHGTMPSAQDMMREMQSLEAMSGSDFDIAYMSMMSEHHTMAVMMATPVLIGGFHGDLYTLASTIVKDQGEEIVQLRDWLRTWYNVPRPGYNPDGTRMPMMQH
jgi:uncharacterized protein (DUF305 family)